MNHERQVDDVEMRWILEIDNAGDQHLVAHWVEADSGHTVATAA